MDINLVKETLEGVKRPAEASAIAAKLGISAEEAVQALKTLVSEGRAVTTKAHRYAPLRLMSLILCRASALPGAPSFAHPVDGGPDIYLDMPDETALDGDLILVRETARDERPRGTLVQIVKRAHAMITGSVYISQEFPQKRRKGARKPHRAHHTPPEALAIVSDRRLPARIPIEGGTSGAKAGDLCLFEVTKWPNRNGQMRVTLSRVIGRADDISAQLHALLAQYGIEEGFGEETRRAADALRLPDCETEDALRRDLRDMIIFTIDGADAQDFDDAVSLTEDGDTAVLGVHIADVSRYVPFGGPIDAEARARGTSVYLPGLTIPMLPEALCNDLCSLRPNEDRLTYSILISIRGGKVVKYELFPARIRSRARLTYDDVNQMLAGEESAVPEELRETLRRMNALAKALTARRIARGAVELDLPEPEFVLDETGMPAQARARARGDAHRLIEEFMLLANETVAAHAQRTELPFPYRVHEAPDAEKLAALETFLASLGRPSRLGSSPSPAKLQAVLKDFENRPESVIVSRTILRSMSRARYLDKPLGHYGLAARDYCHFTSPIRRYPDLLAHRMLRLQAEGKLDDAASAKWAERMGELTREASDCEFRAAQCERDGDNVMCAAYLSRHIGEVYTGIVTHLSKRGAFVALNNTAEGRVPPQLMDDFYSLDDERLMMIGSRSHRVVRLGDKIEVEVYSANIASGEVEFAMTGGR